MKLALLFCLTAAATAVTATSSETDAYSYDLPTGALAKGKVIQGKVVVRTTAQNSTDTLTLKLKVADTTVYTSAAVDEVVDDVAVISFTIRCRSVGASATFIVDGIGTDPDATGTLSPKTFAKVFTADNTGAVTVKCTATWSSSNAGDSCQVEAFEIWEA